MYDMDDFYEFSGKSKAKLKINKKMKAQDIFYWILMLYEYLMDGWMDGTMCVWLNLSEAFFE